MYSQQWPPYQPGSPDHAWPGFREHHPWVAPAAVSVVLRRSPLGLLRFCTPVLAIDGRPLPAGWGRPVVTTVAPGRHHIRVSVPYLIPRRIGAADVMVDAVPGRTVELEYRAPLLTFLKGAFGTPPQKYPGMAATVVMLILTLLLGVFAFGTAARTTTAGAQFFEPEASIPARPSALPTIPALPQERPVIPTEQVGEDESGVPRLREGVPVRRLAGKAFGGSERTRTMAFRGWPFAFRTPESWTCGKARTTAPGAKAYICRDQQAPAGGERVAVLLRPCPAPCGTAEKDQLTREWFSAGTKPRRSDDATLFLEIDDRNAARYQLALGRFFTPEGSSAQWQVGVDASAAPTARAEVRKVVNDILTQTS